ncbi:MAG: Hpt domain-containing protein [Alphaproteobacteria bacterium]|nr:Hpt domain-containing protein [Alphaproteobacteria bacterium]
MALNHVRLDALVSYFGAAETAGMIIRVIDGLGVRVTDLRDAADTSDARRLAHEIKGVASMYGLDAVAEAAQAIEGDAAEATLPGLMVTLERLMVEATRELGAFARGLTS